MKRNTISRNILSFKNIIDLEGLSAILAPGCQTDLTGSARHTNISESNITWVSACQASACNQGLGSSAGHLCANLVGGHLPCRVISTWKSSPQHPPSSLPEGADRQHQVHRDILGLTSLRTQPVRLLPVPRAWAAQWTICVPALS